MRTELTRVWNHPSEPEKHPYTKLRPHAPVTNQALGRPLALHTAGLRGFDCEILYMDEVPEEQVRFHRMNEALYQVTEGRAKIRTVNYKETLDLYTKRYDFGDAIAPWINFLFSENVRDVIDEIASRGLYLINIGGHIPFKTPPIPEEAVAYAREKLGDRFFGMDNGEHDCRFVLGPCDYLFQDCLPTTNEEGWRHFLDYEYRIHQHICRYPITLSNNTFQHYLADIPYTRMLGAQICESKPNIPLWHAILRGACEQYGLRWWTSPAEWNLWGAKGYCGEGWGTPEKGTSLSLLQRAWILTYMYGASAIMGQHAYFYPDKSLSPVGEIFLRTREWIEKHPERGVMHTPVALIWDFYSGYVTGKHAPKQDRPYHCWGNIPYQRGHYMIDAVNDSLFPGMAESGYWQDETGYLCDTPCGDSVDVLLSNTSLYALSKYNAAVVLNAKVEGKLLEVLRSFLAQGGSVMVSISQLTEESMREFGVEEVLGWQESITGSAENVMFNEAPFDYRRVRLSTAAKVVSCTCGGDPLAYEVETTSGGTILVLLSDHGLSRQVCEIPKVCPTNRVLPRPFLLLKHVENLLHRFVSRWNLVQVRGTSGSQWFVNTGENDDTVVVTVSNNHSHVWHGDVRILGANIAEGQNWMTGECVASGTCCELTLAPNSVQVLCLKADRRIMCHAADERDTDEQVSFMSKPVFDAFDGGEMTCRSVQFGYKEEF